MRRDRGASLRALVVTLGLTMAGCIEPVTELVVRVDSDMTPGTELLRVHVRIARVEADRSERSVVVNRVYTLTPSSDAAVFEDVQSSCGASAAKRDGGADALPDGDASDGSDDAEGADDGGFDLDATVVDPDADLSTLPPLQGIVPVDLPGYLSLVPASPDDTRPLHVVVTGFTADCAEVTYESTARFYRGHTIELDIPLVRRCLDSMPERFICGAGFTCGRRGCDPIDQRALPDFGGPHPTRASDASDDAPVCAPGTSRSCYSGPAGTAERGVCRAGQEFCDAEGHWLPCLGERSPEPIERCNGVDDDCDGATDEGCGPCLEGANQACYPGPASQRAQGICRDGAQSCNAAGVWNTCIGATVARAEECNNLDDDCDGMVDDGLTRSCYTGRQGSQNVGVCRAGVATCRAGVWGGCVQQVLPQTEVCDGLDNDCDGARDEDPVCLRTVGVPEILLDRLGHNEGDTDFNGHGPTVTVNVRYSTSITGLLQACADVRMRETVGDWTTGSRSVCVTVPVRAAAVLSPAFSMTYVDSDHGEDDALARARSNRSVSGDETVAALRCQGDRAGEDVCTYAGCAWCRIQFRTVRYRARP